MWGERRRSAAKRPKTSAHGYEDSTQQSLLFGGDEVDERRVEGGDGGRSGEEREAGEQANERAREGV